MINILRRTSAVIESPYSWAMVGLVIGIIFGVTTISVSLLCAGILGFVIHLKLRGKASHDNEGRLFAGGSGLIMAWLVGFVVHGLIF